MAIPLLDFSPSSQNQRVQGYEIPGDEFLRVPLHRSEASGVDDVIAAAYRQMWNEQQILVSNRQKSLESRLKSGNITVREFMAGLATCETFRERNYDTNSNYRFVEMCIQRLLGRQVYGDRERLAWSTVLATQGLQGFIQALLNTPEYLENFGDDTVPYQRRRILPQREGGDRPFARMARYDAAHLRQLGEMGHQFALGTTYRWSWQRPPYPAAAQVLGRVLTYGGALFVLGLSGAVILSWFGLISL